MCVMLVSYFPRTEKVYIRISNFGNFLLVVFVCVFGVGLDREEFMLDTKESDCKASQLDATESDCKASILFLIQKR